MRKGTKVFAWKGIVQREEITIDYRLNAHSGEHSDCLCGSNNCKGFITGSYFSLSEELQRTYLPYAPKFIRGAYRRRHCP
jgi:hypothetical protein